jgi:hypothetical protein
MDFPNLYSKPTMRASLSVVSTIGRATNGEVCPPPLYTQKVSTQDMEVPLAFSPMSCNTLP